MLWHMSRMPNLSEEVLASKKTHAATASDSSTADAGDATTAAPDCRTVQVAGKRVSLTTVKGRGVQPGIDLDSSASLLQQMEDPEQFP